MRQIPPLCPASSICAGVGEQKRGGIFGDRLIFYLIFLTDTVKYVCCQKYHSGGIQNDL